MGKCTRSVTPLSIEELRYKLPIVGAHQPKTT